MEIPNIFKLLCGTGRALFRRTNLRYDGSRSKEVSGGPFAVTIQGVKIKNGSYSMWMNFVGAGVSFGPAEFGWTMSKEDFDAWGTNVYKTPARWRGLELDDLPGAGCIVALSAAMVGGQGASLILFNQGVSGIAEAIVFAGGELVGSPSAGLTVYKGVWFEVSE